MQIKTCLRLLPLLLMMVACLVPEPENDEFRLARMIEVRERAMIEKDIEAAMSQFSDDATWINSQGYYFEGKESVREFHAMLAENTQRDYLYRAGKPRIRRLDSSTALAYYSWNMLWFETDDPDTIVHDEIGLMTLTARKRDGLWQWVAVTNQHTPEFQETIEPVSMSHE